MAHRDGRTPPQTVGERMIRSAALGILFAVGAVTMAGAQTADDQAACQDDAFKICGHTIPDRESCPLLTGISSTAAR